MSIEARTPVEAPVSPAPGNAEHGRVSFGARARVEMMTGMPTVRRVLRKAGPAGLLVAGGYELIAEVLKAKGHGVLPALSDALPTLPTDGQKPGDFGRQVADCVNNAPSAPQPQDGLPHPQPGVPVGVFEACVDKAQQATQNGK